MLRLATVIGIFLVTLVLSGCDSTPAYYECDYEAKQRIKRELAYPSTFDEHGMLTTSMMHDRSSVYGNEEDGWMIDTAVIFGADNGYGVTQDYIVWYKAQVDAEGECWGIEIGNFVPYSG